VLSFLREAAVVQLSTVQHAFQDGMEAKAVEAARSFYANDASIELIAKSLNMPIDKVKEIVVDVEVVQP